MKGVVENINFAEITSSRSLENYPDAFQPHSRTNTASQRKKYLLDKHRFSVSLSYSSDYIYNVFAYLGRALIAHKVTHRNTDRFEVRDLERWEYLGEVRHRGRLYHKFKKETSNGTWIILRVPEMNNSREKPPIVIKHQRGTVTLELLYRNTIDRSFVLDDYTKMIIRIDTYSSFHILDILHDILDLPNRNVDITQNLLRIKLLSPEVYVRFKRYHRTEDGITIDYLFKIDKLLFNIRVDSGIQEIVGSKGIYLELNPQYHIVDMIWKGYRIRIKLYTSKSHPKRDPKLEIIMRDGVTITFDEFMDLERFFEKVKEARKGIKIASGILGAIIEHCQLIPVWDPSEDSEYFSHESPPDEDFLKYLRGIDIWDFLYNHKLPLGFDDLDYEILKIATKRTVVTIPLLNKILQRSESTIRRRIRKLVKAGLLNGTKGKSPNYYWLAAYGSLPELSPEEERIPYLNSAFIKKSAEMIKNKIEKNPITGINASIDDVDLINMGVILWVVGSGWNIQKQLFSFLKILRRELGLKRLSERYVRRYIKILNSLGIIQTRKFGVGSRRQKKNEPAEPVKPVVQYYLLEPELKKLLNKVDYFSFFGF